MYVLCPTCQNPIELAELAAAAEVLCPSCGSSFRLEAGSTTGWSLAGSGEKVGRFEVIRTLGAGACGTVYLARDPELSRTVALKVPRAGNLATPADCERFLREARSVAQLRHPSIVAVHEVGQHDGLPFLVSDFVQGLTLADRLSGRRPAPPEAVRLVAAVADALHYAHDRGIVHRDVKPSNIMLGEDGAPFLMDFGLARREGGEVTMTIEGQVLGTPAYMPPEQARGDSHRVDRRSDVYSLGAVLYQLLTGELPFRGNTRMLLHQVLHDEPRPPRTLNDKLPRDLETICLKAMAKSPARRYASAGDLADDLRRFQAGQPIKARPVGRLERGWRWAQRRPAAAALIAVSVAAVLSVLAVSLAYNERLRSRRDALAAALERATAGERAARTQEADALANLRAGQALVHDYVTAVANDRRLRERDLEGLRKTLLALPVNFYTRLEARSGSDRQARQERGLAYHALADITYALGDSGEAVKLYGKALAVYDALIRDCPDEPSYRARQASIHDNLGVLYDHLGRPRLAEDALNRGLRIRAALVRDHPRNADYQQDLAGSYGNLANLDYHARRDDRAEESYGQAIRILEGLLREQGGAANARRAAFRLSVAHNNLGAVYSRSNRFREAMAAHDRVLALLRPLRQTDPADPEYQDLLVRCHVRRGDVSQAMNRYPEAETSYRTAVERGEKLTAAHPGVTRYQSGLAWALTRRGQLHSETGRFDLAEPALEKAVRILDRVAELSPGAQNQVSLAATLDALVYLYLITGRAARTEAPIRRALELHTRLLATGTAAEGLEQRQYLAVGRLNLGRFYMSTGQPGAAEKAYRAVFALNAELEKTDSSQRLEPQHLALAWMGLAELHLPGQPEQAEAAYRKAIGLWEQLTRTHPAHGPYRLYQSLACMELGMLSVERRRFEQAVELLKQARDQRAALLREHKDAPRYKLELARAHGSLGVAYYFMNRLKESEDSHARHRELLEELVRDWASVTDYRARLVTACNCLGAVHLKQDQWNQAAPFYREARDLGEALARERPNDLQYLETLVLSLRCLGDVYSAIREPDLAEAVYRRLVEVGERFIARQPTREDYQLDLAESCGQAATFYGKFNRAEQEGAARRREAAVWARLTDAHPGIGTFAVSLAKTSEQLGRCLDGLGKGEEALPWYGRSIAALEKLPRRELSPRAAARGLLVQAHVRRARGLTTLGRHTDALKDWERVLELDSGRPRVFARVERALTLARLGDHAKAAAEVREVVEGSDVPGVLFYNAACVLARASTAAARDTALTGGKAVQEAERHAAAAVALLGKARAAGFFKSPTEVDHLKKDSDLDALRLRPDYQKLLGELERFK